MKRRFAYDEGLDEYFGLVESKKKISEFDRDFLSFFEEERLDGTGQSDNDQSVTDGTD